MSLLLIFDFLLPTPLLLTFLLLSHCCQIHLVDALLRIPCCCTRVANSPAANCFADNSSAGNSRANNLYIGKARLLIPLRITPLMIIFLMLIFLLLMHCQQFFLMLTPHAGNFPADNSAAGNSPAANSSTGNTPAIIFP